MSNGTMTAKLIVRGRPVNKKNCYGIGYRARPCRCGAIPKIVLQDPAKTWESDAILQLRSQWGRPSLPNDARVKMIVETFMGKGQHLDCPGLAEAPADAMEAAGIFANDYSIDETVIRRFRDRDDPRQEIRLWIPDEQLTLIGDKGPV